MSEPIRTKATEAERIAEYERRMTCPKCNQYGDGCRCTETEFASHPRYVLTAVVFVPSDEPHSEDGMQRDFHAVLKEAGYAIKYADASLVEHRVISE